MPRTTHWSEAIDELRARIESRPRLLVASDFDGTLAPVVPRPEAARLPAETADCLRRIGAAPGVFLAFVSGRSLPDLEARVGIPGAFYIGSHGLELSGPGLAEMPADAAAFGRRLSEIGTVLEASVAGLPGVRVERKSLGLALHLREAPPVAAATARDMALKMLGTIRGFRLQPGHCVLELRPDCPGDKGTAVLRVLTHLRVPPSAAWFFGDDATDEHAFSVLPDAFTVRVGHGESAARFCAHDPDDLLALLQRVASWHEASSSMGDR